MNNNIKSSFDAFNPTDEQKMRMLKNIQNKAYANNVFDFKKIYIPLACAAAAAFVFFIGGGIFDTQTPNIIDTPQIVKVDPDTSKQTQTETKNEELKNNIQTAVVPEVNSNVAKPHTPVKAEPNNKESSFEQVFESVDNNKEATQQETTVQLVLNSVPQSEPYDMARSMPETAASDEQNLEQHKNVTYNEFCDELGYDIITTVKLPENMQNITREETEIPTEDITEWDVTFIGDGARCISINASTDMSKNDEYINGDYKKTDVNGNEAVVFYDENYTAYMNTQNANYKVITIDISEQEFIDILTSLK